MLLMIMMAIMVVMIVVVILYIEVFITLLIRKIVIVCEGSRLYKNFFSCILHICFWDHKLSNIHNY